MGRKVAGFVFLLLCMCLAKGTASSAATQVAAGSCGENATWTLDDKNVLTIHGTGKISERSWEQSQQWQQIEEYPSPYDYSYDIEEDDPHFVTVVIEKGITEIGKQSFSSPYIKNLTIPDGVTKIGAWAFEYSSIKSLDIPHSVVEIGGGAFAHCRQLTEVHLPENLTRINYHMFYGCIALKNMTIPDSVTEIETTAFDLTRNLEEVTFGKSLTTIPDQLFAGSLRLRKIVNHSCTCFSLSRVGAETKLVTWNDDGGSVTDIPPGKTVSGQGKKYKIHYVTMKGVKVKGTLPGSFRYGESVKFPGKVTKKGYLFVGWNISDGYSKDDGEDGGGWDTLRTDSDGEIFFDGLADYEKDTGRRYTCKITPGFVKMKVQKKPKKTIVQVDCRKLPKGGMSSADVAIRYADNKKMKKFKVACKSKYVKKMKFILPKSFWNRKCYMQFAMVDNDSNNFLNFYKETGWEITGQPAHSWFWSKTVVSKGK